MLRRIASLVPRPALGVLVAVLGFQVAASGAVASCPQPGDAQLAGHAPAITLPPPSTPVALEVEHGDAGTGPLRSPSPVDDRPHPASDDTPAEVRPSWRADDALARAGRLSAPSTAPPLSGA